MSEQKNQHVNESENCPYLLLRDKEWVCLATDWGVTSGLYPKKVYGHVLAVEVLKCLSNIHMKCPNYQNMKRFLHKT